MAASHRPGASYRWLFPVLVVLLVLGHACELPAYAELMGHHGEATEEPGRTGHDDEHALTCDGALVLPSHEATGLAPGLVMAVMAPAAAATSPRPALATGARPIRSSTGPPLFLLFSSLLI